MRGAVPLGLALVVIGCQDQAPITAPSDAAFAQHCPPGQRKKDLCTPPAPPAPPAPPGSPAPPPPEPPAPPAPGPWVATYITGWDQDDANRPVRWSSGTHFYHFSVLPNSDGTLNTSLNGLSAHKARTLLTQARTAGKKVLISVGGHPGSEGFPGAASSANRARFVGNLIAFMDNPFGLRDSHGLSYDGIDIDWEFNGANDTNLHLHVALMRDLRDALNARGKGELLQSTLLGGYTAASSAIHPHVDRVALMTYVPYMGPQRAVHLSPLREPSPSPGLHGVDRIVGNHVAGGVPVDKLMFGFSYYAWVYHGAQNIGDVPFSTSYELNLESQQVLPHRTPANEVWDSNAQTSFWRVTGPNARIIAGESDRSIEAKAAYLEVRGLGGVIIWSHRNGWISSLPAGQRDPLARSVATHFSRWIQ